MASLRRLLTAALLVAALPAAAQTPGRLSPEFSTDGIVFGSSANSDASAVVSDAAGVVTLVGTTNQPCGRGTAAFVARYTPDGKPVAGFGQNGVARFGACGADTEGQSIAALPDGSFLILTTRADFRNDYEARRILPTGQQTCQEPVLFDAVPYGSATTPDGTVVVAVQSTDPADLRDVARVFVNYVTGACGLDQTFGRNGFARVPVVAGLIDAYDVAVQTDGRIVVGGDLTAPSSRQAPDGRPVARRAAIQDAHRGGGTTSLDPFVARLTASGSPDVTFGLDRTGLAVTRTPGVQDGYTAVATGPTGEIVGAGLSYVDTDTAGTPDRFLVGRYRFDGLPDPAFGTNGALVFEARPGQNGYATDVVVDAEARIVAVGFVRDAARSTLGWVLARLNAADGSPDAHFGTNGITVEQPRGNSGFLTGVALGPGDDLYVAGAADFQAAGQRVYAVARYAGKSPVTAGEDAPEAASALAVFPNPTRGAATLAVTQAEVAQARIVLVDALGREAAVVFEGTLAAGPHRLPVPTAGLPPGVYSVRTAGQAPVRLVVAR